MVTQSAAQARTHYLFVSADAIGAGNASWLEQQWEAARIKLAQHQTKEFLLVIDEIQKIDTAVKL